MCEHLSCFPFQFSHDINRYTALVVIKRCRVLTNSYEIDNDNMDQFYFDWVLKIPLFLQESMDFQPDWTIFL